MNTKSKFSYYYSTFKSVAPHYVNLFKRGLVFVLCVMTFPVFLLIRGAFLLYRVIIK